MSDFLLDSNVLLDVLTEDPDWIAWSVATMQACRKRGRLCINPLVFAEVSLDYPSPMELERDLPPSLFVRLELPWEAAWHAGRAFAEYRRRGGTRRSPMPDFYIGAHARVAHLTLVTRDVARYRTYFKDVPLMVPEGL